MRGKSGEKQNGFGGKTRAYQDSSWASVGKLWSGERKKKTAKIWTDKEPYMKFVWSDHVT